MDDTRIIREEIASRKRTYESSKSRGLRSLRRGNLNDALYWFYAAARVLGYFHFGLWMDTVLEEALWQIANRIDSTNGRVVPVSIRKKQVVHLASYLMDYGGHSEMILNWSRSLAGLGSPDQYFLSSELPQARCTSLELAPHKLMELTRSSTDCRLCPQKLQPFPRARWLFNELQNIRPDVVILHVHPEDVFSFCAARAAQTRLGSRIVYFNMADHLPNIGMAWTD